MNNKIHLGNYEEFFVLYMDNELDEQQVKMVDRFLEAHPDLKAELDILMSTKLPPEQFSFDKEELMSDKLKLPLIDEELLLYIDNELPFDQKNEVERKLDINKNFKRQHEILSQAKLDPSEKIVYPNKEELYRRTERVFVMAVWMRVAAAVIIIAAAGLLYFRNTSSTVATRDTQTSSVQTEVKTPLKQEAPKNISPKKDLSEQSLATVKSSSNKKNNYGGEPRKKRAQTNESNGQPLYAQNDPQENAEDFVKRTKVNDIAPNAQKADVTFLDPKVSINEVGVTSSPLPRPTDDPKGSIASNDRKGSVKGFLRKATRVIEKRTGFDPTNENGELLIGAVAISLK